jgi:hypothetical protein
MLMVVDLVCGLLVLWFVFLFWFFWVSQLPQALCSSLTQR